MGSDRFYLFHFITLSRSHFRIPFESVRNFLSLNMWGNLWSLAERCLMFSRCVCLQSRLPSRSTRPHLPALCVPSVRIQATSNDHFQLLLSSHLQLFVLYTLHYASIHHIPWISCVGEHRSPISEHRNEFSLSTSEQQIASGTSKQPTKHLELQY